MLPVLTPVEMTEVDRRAPEPVDVLVERSGAAVARAALDLLGGAYGRRVVVVAGKGNNGADGRAAARRLARRGVRVVVVDAASADPLPASDLVVDAAYGTGLHGPYEAPDPAGAPVLAVDVPSGVDGTTGRAQGRPPRATATVALAALKPGLLLGDGPDLAGEVIVADIGLEVASAATAWVVEASDVSAWVPPTPRDAHKWRSSALVVAGSAPMTGAAVLAVAAAARSGAGMVRAGTPGRSDGPGAPVEAVGVDLAGPDWATAALEASARVDAALVGPGLGTAADDLDAVRRLVARLEVPVVVDGDGLRALGDHAAAVLAARSAPCVLTPHDGEAARLAGAPPGPDRLAAARSLAARTGAVVLLKGPVTVVAEPGGQVRMVTTGDRRLATAGTGDVLAGVIVALLARGTAAFDAAAAGAWLHGRAGAAGPRWGLVASDLLDALRLARAEVGR